jgi:hypothetical protein
MKHGTLILLLALLFPTIFAFLGGCTSGKGGLHPASPAPVAVRVPPLETPKIGLRAEEPWRQPAEPFSVGDEYRDRWLRIFEVDVTPPEAGEPPPPANSP